MLWRWYQDWRERRSALKEMDQLREADERELMGKNQNPLTLAMAALKSGDMLETAALWEEARRVVPDAVLKSKDSLDILLGLKRFDEAEALMRDRQKRLFGDQFCLTGLAAVAEQRGDTVQALKRWEVVRDRVRDSIDGYDGCSRCLVNLGRFDEAATQLNLALRRDSFSVSARVGLARIADRKRDWPQSLARWKELAEVYRDPPAFAFAARALAELGRADEAESYLAGPARAYLSNPYIATTYAELAERRGDVAAACDRWSVVRAIDPYMHAGYHEGAYRLVDAGRYAEAEAVLRTAIERFPNDVWPLRNLAQIAHDQRNWTEAAARWEALRARFPEEAIGYSLGAEALRADGRDEEAARLRRPS